MKLFFFLAIFVLPATCLQWLNMVGMSPGIDELISSISMSFLPGIFGNRDLTYENRVSCRAIQASPGKDAYITTTYQGGKQWKVPIFIFRYATIYEDVYIMSWQRFLYGTKHKWYNANYFEKNLPVKGDMVLLNSAVSATKREITLNVTESGVYCVYALPEISDHEFTVSILARNSHGYLYNLAYVEYTQLKYLIFLSLILFGLLFNYILRFKVGDDFTNLNSVSIISKATLFYVLLPTIAITFLQMCGGYLVNNFEYFNGSKPVLLMIPGWLEAIYTIGEQFFLLLFSMGYGVIYSVEQGSSKYRKIPDKLWKRATKLLSINLVGYTVSVLIDKFFPPKGVVVTASGVISCFVIILRYNYLLFPFIWLTFTSIHFSRTKQAISKFSVTSNEEEIAKLFRKSRLLIVVLPNLVAILAMVIIWVKNIFSDWMDALQMEIDMKDFSDLSGLFSEFFILGGPMSNIIVWVTWINWLRKLATIGGIFAIWTRSNYGIIIEDKKDKFYELPAYNDTDSVEPYEN